MEIFSPGKGINALKKGVVTFVSDSLIRVDNKNYKVLLKGISDENLDKDALIIFPTKAIWQIPVVKVGDQIKKKQLLAKGVTKIYFQANLWIFAI
jgi:NNP family nitrate/nitrite transporter-like MFS transporter